MGRGGANASAWQRVTTGIVKSRSARTQAAAAAAVTQLELVQAERDRLDAEAAAHVGHVEVPAGMLHFGQRPASLVGSSFLNPHPFRRHRCSYPVTTPARRSARRRMRSMSRRCIEPSGRGKTSFDGERRTASSSHGTSSSATGRRSA